jgi:hypothetical protein
MRLNPARFNRFLAKIGQDLAWQPSSACPCVQPFSGSPDPNCPHCDGKGRLWGTSVPCSAGIVSRDIMRQAAPMAILDAGDVMLVIPSDQPIYAIGEYDRVVMTDRSEPFSLNLIAGANALRFNPVSIDRITWLDEEGDLVDGTLPRSWANGVLTWPPLAAKTPPAGVTVAITGRRHPEYFCWLTLTLDRPHHSGAPLPRRVVLRRFDLFGA